MSTESTATGKSVTLSVTMEAAYDAAFDYLSDPRNLPEWSVNFVTEVRGEGNRLVATTPMGEVPVGVRGDRELGVVDVVLGGRPFAARLVPNGGGCDYSFTLQKPPGMPDEAWEGEGVPGLREELDALKGVLESRA